MPRPLPSVGANEKPEGSDAPPRGSLNTRGAGSDYKRSYTFSGNRLTLQPPAAENGTKTELTWEKLPDLSESELTETHRRLFGFYRIESVSRRIVGGAGPGFYELTDTHLTLRPPALTDGHFLRHHSIAGSG